MRSRLGTPRGEWRTDRASLAIWTPAPRMLVTAGDGHFDAVLGTRIVDAGNAVIAASGRLVGFHDWQGVNGYDTATRRTLTDWGSSVRAQVDEVHILVGSKLLKMGVAVASIVLVGMLVPYDDRTKFEAALVAALRAA